MHARVGKLGVDFRPHIKTCKSVDIAQLMLVNENDGIAASTLKEAAYFNDRGIHDIIYAVGITPDKLWRVLKLMQEHADIKIMTDEPAAAAEIVRFAQAQDTSFKVLLEIDSDGHRAGLKPHDPKLLEAAKILHESKHSELSGLLTHGGSSYACRSSEKIAAVAEMERSALTTVAQKLSEHGIPCPILTVGSTPTATFGKGLDGINELRAGVFVFQDLFQAGLGVCGIEDIALAVLATVTGYKHDKQQLIIDAGALALSKDRSTAALAVDLGYGLAYPLNKTASTAELLVEQVFQEHGVVKGLNGPLNIAEYPLGSKLLVLPNHACMTAAAYNNYLLINEQQQVVDQWQRCNGW